MHSRAEHRLLLERLCRAGAIAALIALIALVGKAHSPLRAKATTHEQLDQALARGTRERLAVLGVEFDRLPDDTTISWLAALRDAGTQVSWDVHDSLAAVALSAEPIPGPEQLTRITITGAPAGPLVVRDEIGILDSAGAPAGGTRELTAHASGALSVALTRGVLSTPLTDSIVDRAVLILARAGWEGAFTAAALEEAGWQVEAEFVVTPRGVGASGQEPDPGSSVRTRGASTALDTSHFAAVVVLDPTSPSRASAIARFVAQGGGLIANASGATGALSTLMPARPAEAVRAVLGGIVSQAPRSGLPGTRLVSLTNDALELEREHGVAMVVARRHELGRVLMIGYDDLWRWRMEGGENAPLEHRLWWSSMVSSVAYAPLVRTTTTISSPAPLAQLYATLGARHEVGELPEIVGLPWMHLLLGASILLLLVEWTSRRLRGTP